MDNVTTSLPAERGRYVLMYAMVDHGAADRLRDAAAAGPGGTAFKVDGPRRQTRGMILELHDAQVETDAHGIETYARTLLDAGARIAILHIEEAPDGQRNVAVEVYRDALGNDGPMRVHRHPTKREEAGGAPLTPRQQELRSGRRAAARPPEDVVRLSDKADVAVHAAELARAVSRGLGEDLPASTANEIVTDALRGDGTIDAERLSGTLAAEIGVSVPIARMFVLGARRRTQAPVPAIEAVLAQAAPSMAGRSGDLAANAGFQRLVADVAAQLARAPSKVTQTEAAITLAALLTIADGAGAISAAMGDQRSDRVQFINAVKRAVAVGDAHALGDAYAHAPRAVAASMRDAVADAVSMAGRQPSSVHFSTALAGTLADEPDFRTDQMWNYGPRWRPLGAPDHLLLASKLDNPMLAHGWIRTSDTTRDADGRIFDPEGQFMLPGDDHDFSDVMWMVGLGPDAEHVHPLFACFVGRETVQPGHLEIRHMPLGTAEGRHEDQAMRALAIALHSQTMDDIEWLVGKHGAITTSITTSDPVPKTGDEAKRLLSYQYMGQTFRAIAALNRTHGHVVTILKDGMPVDDGRVFPEERLDERPQREGESRFEAVEMAAQLGTDPWGAIGIATPDGVRFLRVETPDDTDENWIATRNEIAAIEQGSPEHFDILDEASDEALMRIDGVADETWTVEAAMARHGRAMLIEPGFDGPPGVTFGRPLPGVGTPATLGMLIERHRAGDAPQFVLPDEGPDERDQNESGAFEALLDAIAGGRGRGHAALADILSLTTDEAEANATGFPVTFIQGVERPGDPRWWSEGGDPAAAQQALRLLHVDVDGDHASSTKAFRRATRFIGAPINGIGRMDHGGTARIDVTMETSEQAIAKLAGDMVRLDGAPMAAIAWSGPDGMRLLMAKRNHPTRLYALRR